MFSATAVFLVKTLFELYIMVLFLRVFLQYYRANFFNPVSQLVLKLTNPVLVPIKPYFPGFRGVDLGVVSLLFLLEVIKLTLMVRLGIGYWPPISTVIVLGLFELLSDLTMFLFYILLARVILSWVASPQSGALQEISYLITEPMLAPVRRRIPPVSGFDLSPLIVSIGLLAINTLLGSVTLVLT